MYNIRNTCKSALKSTQVLLDHTQGFRNDMLQTVCYPVPKGLKSLQVAAVFYSL